MAKGPTMHRPGGTHGRESGSSLGAEARVMGTGTGTSTVKPSAAGSAVGSTTGKNTGLPAPAPAPAPVGGGDLAAPIVGAAGDGTITETETGVAAATAASLGLGFEAAVGESDRVTRPGAVGAPAGSAVTGGDIAGAAATATATAATAAALEGLTTAAAMTGTSGDRARSRCWRLGVDDGATRYGLPPMACG